MATIYTIRRKLFTEGEGEGQDQTTNPKPKNNKKKNSKKNNTKKKNNTQQGSIVETKDNSQNSSQSVNDTVTDKPKVEETNKPRQNNNKPRNNSSRKPKNDGTKPKWEDKPKTSTSPVNNSKTVKKGLGRSWKELSTKNKILLGTAAGGLALGSGIVGYHLRRTNENG